ARDRDTHWEAELQKAHAGWAETRDAHDRTHAELGNTLTELGATRDRLSGTLDQLAATRADLDTTRADLGTAQEDLAVTRNELAAVRASRSYRLGLQLTAPVRWAKARLRGAPQTGAAESPGAVDVSQGPPSSGE